MGNPEMTGRGGKECEFVHNGPEARRPRKSALRRVNRNQMMGRSTPWKGIFSDTTHNDQRSNSDQSRGGRMRRINRLFAKTKNAEI